MLHKEFFGLSLLFFFLWIMFTTNASERIEHTCAPVGWLGSVVTSGTGLILPGHQQQVQGVFDNTAYGCKFVVWRLFYQDAYNKFLDSQKSAPAGQSPASPAAVPSEAHPPADNTVPNPLQEKAK